MINDDDLHTICFSLNVPSESCGSLTTIYIAPKLYEIFSKKGFPETNGTLSEKQFKQGWERMIDISEQSLWVT